MHGIHGFPVALAAITFSIAAGLWSYKRFHRITAWGFGLAAFFLAAGIITIPLAVRGRHLGPRPRGAASVEWHRNSTHRPARMPDGRSVLFISGFPYP